MDSTNDLRPTEALAEAVRRIGSQSELGRLLGISQNAVSKWVREKKELPAEHVPVVSRETGIPRHVLRPDLWEREAGEADNRPAALRDDARRSALDTLP